MTVLDEVAPGPSARPFGELVAQQLAGIEAFLADRAAALSGELSTEPSGARPAEPSPASREERMDLARRREVLEREYDALLARLDDHLRDDVDVLRTPQPTALVAHRHPWFREKVGALLSRRGLHVLGATPVGAEAVGWAVADQPDLVVVDQSLMMLAGEQVVREVRRYCPDAVVVRHLRGAAASDVADEGLRLLTG